MNRSLLVAVASILPFAVTSTAGDTNFQVNGGTVSFTADTNFSAVTVHGKSDRLMARFRIREEEGNLVIENLDAELDSSNLTTGMNIRDRHMRERIFTTSNGSVPPLRFHSDQVTCPAAGGGAQSACEFNGTFFLRGVGQPLKVALRIRPEGSGKRQYRVSGQGTIRLSEFGIEPPTQLGVTVKDDVNLRLDFLAKPEAGVTASR